MPPDKGRSQDRPLPIASTARRRLARSLAGAGCRAAPVRLSPAPHSSARRRPRVELKKTQRLYREEGLTVHRRKRRKRATGMRAPIRVEARPNARWSVDFVHDQLSNGRRFRILNVIDDVTKECLAVIADTSISGRRVARARRHHPLARQTRSDRLRPRNRVHLQRYARLGSKQPDRLAFHGRENRCRTGSAKRSTTARVTNC